MNTVTNAAPGLAATPALAGWPERVGAAYSIADRSAIAAALDIARTRYGAIATADGEAGPRSRAGHGDAILAGLKLDPDSIRAALLLGLPPVAVHRRRCVDRAILGADVAHTRGRRGTHWAPFAPHRRPATAKPARGPQAENLRKMLLSMVEDIRVVLIKLAERTQALRSLIPPTSATPAVRTQGSARG